MFLDNAAADDEFFQKIYTYLNTNFYYDQKSINCTDSSNCKCLYFGKHFIKYAERFSPFSFGPLLSIFILRCFIHFQIAIFLDFS